MHTLLSAGVRTSDAGARAAVALAGANCLPRDAVKLSANVSALCARGSVASATADYLHAQSCNARAGGPIAGANANSLHGGACFDRFYPASIMSNAPEVAAAPEVVSLLEPRAVFSAICDPMRHALLRVLADGAPRSVNDLAAKLRRPADGISKHLRILRNARVIRTVSPADGDGRKQFHELPALFRSRDAAGKTVLDFGVVLLRLE